MDKKAVYCHERGGGGRMDGCVELTFTSIKSRVIALITAGNNSNPLVGNSLREETECDSLPFTVTHITGHTHLSV